MEGTLALYLLGRPRVSCAGKQVTEFISSKSQATLFYLALAPGAQARERIAGLLWPDVPTKNASANLRNVIANLRKLVGDHLIVTRQTIGFDFASPHTIDVAQFLQQDATDDSPRQQINKLQTACDLYAGQFLEGFDVRSSDLFEEWMLQQRTRLEDELQTSLLKLGQLCLDEGSYSQGIAAAKRLLAIEPWQEAAHRLLMQLLFANDERSAAVEQYAICKQLLAEELGVEPSAATQRVYEQLQRQNTAIVHNLPAETMPFIGRKKALTTLRKQLNAGDYRLLSIVGVGGIGKTSLAFEVSQRAVQPAPNDRRFVHGVYFVDLTRLESRDDSAVMRSQLTAAIAHTIGLRFRGKDAPVDQLLRHLSDKTMLLTLDNFEHLLDAAPLLTAILKKAYGVTLLVTSRERLNLMEEWVLPLDGLQMPDPLAKLTPKLTFASAPDSTDSNPYSQHAAIKLFQYHAEKVGSRTLATTKKADIARICQAVGGVPLAIKLAASWQRVLSAEQIANQLEQSLDILATKVRNVQPRHRSLRLLFESTWQLLDDVEQTLLQQLSILRGRFDLDAISAITTTQPLLTLRALIDKSLLRQASDNHYFIVEYIRQFAAEQLRKNTELYQKTRVAQLRYFAALLKAQEDTLVGSTPHQAIDSIATNYGSIYSVWNWAVKHQKDDAIEKMHLALSRYWRWFGTPQSGTQLFEEATTSFTAAAYPRLHGKLQLQLAYLHKEMVDIERTITAVQRAITVLGQEDENNLLMTAHNIYGGMLTSAGEHEAGAAQLDLALALADQVDDVRVLLNHYLWRAVLHYNLAIRADAQGNKTDYVTFLAKRRTVYKQALALAHTEDHADEKIMILEGLATTDKLEGKHVSAKRYLQHALKIARRIDKSARIIFLTLDIAMLVVAAGNIREATEHVLAVFDDVSERQLPEEMLYIIYAMAALCLHSERLWQCAMLNTFLAEHPQTLAGMREGALTQLEGLRSQVDSAEFTQAQLTSQSYTLNILLKAVEQMLTQGLHTDQA